MAETMVLIKIKSDFSAVPGGRFKEHGPFSGEEFRDSYLVPALSSDEKVVVLLDGALGYPGSFLEEAFGGLIRVSGFSLAQLQKKLEIRADDERYEVYRQQAEKYIRDADEARRRNRVA